MHTIILEHIRHIHDASIASFLRSTSAGRGCVSYGTQNLYSEYTIADNI